MSSPNEPYVTFNTEGISDLSMNRIVFVSKSMLIPFAVDPIHLISYLNFVMSSWCLRDLPVSDQIPAFSISGKLIVPVLVLGW
jgi:hypothetical protein